VLATVDIERLGREIADAAKRTQETSPEFLQKRIAALERAGKGNGAGETVRELAQLRAEIEHLTPLAGRAAALTEELRVLENAHREILAGMRALVENHFHLSRVFAHGAVCY